MASTSTRPLSETSPGATTFSYAQAAKGRGASGAPSTVQSSQGTSGANTPSKELTSFTDAPSGSVNGTGISEIDRIARTNGDSTLRAGSSGPEIESKTTAIAISGPSSPSVGTASTATLPKEDMNSSTPNLLSDSPWDRQSGSSNEKPAEGAERKKGKKGKKEKAADKEPELEKENAKPVVLVSAPPPAVNFWQQRREAQAAISKANPPVTEPSQSPDTNGITATSATKSLETKKKGKSSSEEQEKGNTAGQNNGGKEGQVAKGQKKSEGNSRSKEDSNGKRAPRGARVSEKEEKSPVSQLPPPVEDSISWPTPETALEDEKRKAQTAQEKVEKEDRDESASNKPRSKKEWVTVPYVPTVAFNTPLPARGGRGGRGGGRGGGRDGNARNGHASNGSVSGDKPFASTNTSNTNDSRERGRDNSNNHRAASLPPNSSKRSVGEDQRKASAIAFEKPKADSFAASIKAEHSTTRDNRRSSINPHGDVFSAHQTSNQQGFGKPDGPNGTSVDLQTQQKAGGPDRKVDPNAYNDLAKDVNGQGANRDRGDGRPERGGRGGAYRGRGGHNNFPNGQQLPPNIFTNGQVTQPTNGYQVRQNSGPYSPPIQQQPQYGSPFTGNPAMRVSRNSLPPPRSQSISNNNNMYPRYSPNMGPGPQQMAPIQTGGPIFDYNNVGSMSAVPYNPYVEQWSILSMVTMQLEYYFSIDNLCKDIFLRKHMDSQGFVILSFIAGFKRIQTLTLDYQLVRYACQESETIEIIHGEDGIERVRRRDGWEKWTLGIEDRDPIAQNDGPSQLYPLQPQNMRPQQMMSMMPPPQAPLSAPAFSANGTESSFQPFQTASMNTIGIDNTTFQHTESPMSAAVPEFAPRHHPNGIPNPDFEALQVETTFPDEQIDNLTLVWKTDTNVGDSKAEGPYQGSSSRTFSNGSIDVRSIAEELLSGVDKRPGRTLANGSSPGSDISPDGIRRSKSPFTSMSPTKPTFGNAPPVMWAKTQNQQIPISESNARLSYGAVRERALRHRESSATGVTHSDMQVLYDFWSHFLIRNFNPRMYLEFRDLAFDDSRNRQDATGVKKLVQFYDEILNSKKKTIPEVFATHYVDLVRSEDQTKERPGFTKLRAAWRNGALDMKSRKKIDTQVDPKLREELER